MSGFSWRIGRFGFCPCCGELSTTIERRPQNTLYVDESMNWFIGCLACHEDNEAYWAERWAEYYSGVL